MQVVQFPTIPGAKPVVYLSVLGKLITHAREQNPDPREMRDWLKDEGLWDRERTPQLLSFLGLSFEPGAGRTTGLARVLESVRGESEISEAVGKWFWKLNPLLAAFARRHLKERVFSTNELYKLVTSFEYKGKPITLPDFRNWIDWVQALGGISLLGVRWKIGPAWLENVYLERFDEDEFFEDEAADAADGAAAAPLQSAVSSHPATAPQARIEPHGHGLSPSPASSASNPGDDDEADGWNEDLAEADGNAPIQESMPRRTVAGAMPPVARRDRDLFAIAERIAATARTLERDPLELPHYPDGPIPYRAFMAALYANLASCASQSSPGGPVGLSGSWGDVMQLEAAGFWRRMYDETLPLDEALLLPEWNESRAGRLSLWIGRVPKIRRHLKSGLVARLSEAESSADVVQILAEAFDVQRDPAPFFFIRELLRMGWLQSPHAELLAVVPDRFVREAAVRFGFLATAFPEQGLADVALSLGRYFGAEQQWDLALRSVALCLDCHFGCRHRRTCPLDCLEKWDLP